MVKQVGEIVLDFSTNQRKGHENINYKKQFVWFFFVQIRVVRGQIQGKVAANRKYFYNIKTFLS